jgi:hypothetical protein
MTQQFTPTLALPYYQGTDPADGATQQQALATKLDGINWTSLVRPAVVVSPAALPAGSDGLEVFYVANATLGIVWRLRYRSASASAYKWEVIGGPPLVAFDGTRVFRAANVSAYGEMAIPGPNTLTPLTLTLPALAGDWDVQVSSEVTVDQANCATRASYDVGVTAAADSWSLLYVTPSGSPSSLGTVERMHRHSAVASAAVLRYMATSPNAGIAYHTNRRLSAMPVRLG